MRLLAFSENPLVLLRDVLHHLRALADVPQVAVDAIDQGPAAVPHLAGHRPGGHRCPVVQRLEASGTVRVPKGLRPNLAGAAAGAGSVVVENSLNLDLSRMPPPRTPFDGARDGQWLRFLGESLMNWEANGGRFEKD